MLATLDPADMVAVQTSRYKALHILLPKTADEWVRKPNRAEPFGGRSALDWMMSGNVADLYVVRQYVDGQRG